MSTQHVLPHPTLLRISHILRISHFRIRKLPNLTIKANSVILITVHTLLLNLLHHILKQRVCCLVCCLVCRDGMGQCLSRQQHYTLITSHKCVHKTTLSYTLCRKHALYIMHTLTDALLRAFVPSDTRTKNSLIGRCDQRHLTNGPLPTSERETNVPWHLRGPSIKTSSQSL